jgi:predicted phosphoserine aminotransferase
MSDRRRPPTGGFGRFFLPGPTEVHPEVLDAAARPVIGHRGPEMRELMGAVQPGLQRVFGTERPVYVSTSSATGLMEAAVSNLSRRRVLALVCGAFSGRFEAIARRLGRPVDVLEVEWGRANRPGPLRDRLRDAAGAYDLVTAVHSETSTGVLNPVAELAEVVAGFDDVLLAVDGVSSVGGAPVDFDEWGVDFMLTGAQKALALPPGLSFAVASERALERAEEVSRRSYYFDLLDFERRVRDGQTPNTPAVSLIYALRRQLERIEAEGLEARWDRHARMARRTHRWAGEMSRKGREVSREGRASGDGEPGVVAPEGYRSPTVTAVRLPPDHTGPEVAAAVRDRGWVVAPGYGKMTEGAIRIGHMGDQQPESLEGLLEALAEVLSG